MGEIVNISAEVRDKAGKGIARSVRREGKVPAIIYGNNEDAIAIALDGKQLGKLIRNPGFFTQIFSVDVTGNKHGVYSSVLGGAPQWHLPCNAKAATLVIFYTDSDLSLQDFSALVLAAF